MLRLGLIRAPLVQRAHLLRLGPPLRRDDLRDFGLRRLCVAEGGRGHLLHLVRAVEDPGVGGPGGLGACAACFVSHDT